MKSYFWGIFLITSGIFLVLKYYLNLNISTGRVLLGLFLLTLGLSVLIGGFGIKDGRQVIFDQGRMETTTLNNEYDIVFGQGTLDLTDITKAQSGKKIKVDCVFGSGEIILPKDLSVYIKADAAFGSIVFPDGSNLSFGDKVYSNVNSKSDADIVIELDMVFGRTEIRQK